MIAVLLTQSDTCKFWVAIVWELYMMISISINRGPLRYDCFRPISCSTITWRYFYASKYQSLDDKKAILAAKMCLCCILPIDLRAVSSSSGCSDVCRWHAAFKNFSWSVTYIGGVSYKKEVDLTFPIRRSCVIASLKASTLSPTLLPIAMYASCRPLAEAKFLQACAP